MKLMKKVLSAALIAVMILVSIPVTAHAANASMSFGIGRMFSGEFTEVNVIDFGTVDLSQGVFTASKPILIKNKSGESTITIGVVDEQDQYGNWSPFSDAYLSWNPPSYSLSGNNTMADDTVYLDVSYFPAGTYTANFYITPNSGTLDINNGAIHANSEGTYLIPITVTVTGVNPNFAPQIQNLRANAGNGVVELWWDEPDGTIDITYTLYRMEGVPTGAPGQTTDAWEMIAEEIPWYEAHYIDQDAENGKTYSYTVVAGAIGRGNCSEPVTAVPSAGYVERLESLDTFSAFDDEGGVFVDWDIDVPGQGQIREDIDHFNIYRNGILHTCVDYNGYTEDWVEHFDYDLNQYVIDYINKWGLTIDSEPGVLYSWYMCAVDKNGIEGYPSRSYYAEGKNTKAVIERYHAYFDDRYQTPEDEASGTYRNAVCIEVYEDTYYGIKHIDVWRDGAYIGQFKSGIVNNCMSIYDTENVQADTTYAYTIQITDRNNQVSEPVTFYLTTDDEGEVSYIDYSFGVRNEDTPMFILFGEEDSTYKLYRNGELLKTIQGENKKIALGDTPDTDGTYVYYLTRTTNGNTVSTPEHTYIRNTVPEIPPQKPSAPVINARIVDDGQVSITWTPTMSGGEAEGYYIYKTKMNEGAEAYCTDKFYESDGYWSGEPSQGRYIRLYADKTSFIDDQAYWWNEDQMPIRYWVCAYNKYGVSDPSEVIPFNYNGGAAPENNNTEAPGKPRIISVWDEADPDRLPEYADVYRNMFVSFEGPTDGGMEDSFEVVIRKKNSQGQYENGYLQDKTTTDRYLRKYDISINSQYSYNDVGSYKITVVAVNTVNGVEHRTESDPYYYDISYPPILTLSGGTDHIDLTWTDATANVTAADYEIWRKPEHGLWEQVAVPQSAISYNGTEFTCTDNTVTSGVTYVYYVLRNKDGVRRASREQTAKPSASMVTPGAPTNLNVKRLGSDTFLVTWDAPTTGGTASGYVIQLRYDDSDGTVWNDAETIVNSSTGFCGYLSRNVLRVVACNDGGRGPASEEFDASDLPVIEASSYPPYVWPHAVVGDSTLTVTWDYDTYTGSNAVQYFQIVRQKNDGELELVEIVPADPSVTSYAWTDPDVENGNYYEYWVYPTNGCGYEHYNWGMSYSAWGTPEGPTLNSDQTAAQTVEDLIATLPDAGAFDPADEEAAALIRDVQEIYEGLTEEQRQYINPDARQQIEDLIDMIDQADAEEKYENNEAVANVQALIDALPNTDSVTQATDAIISQAAQARQAYAALPADAKRVVDTAKLDALEQKISQLQRQAADLEAAQNAITAINALPDPSQVTLNNASQVRAQVNNAKVLYESLTPAQKDMFASADGGAAALEKLAGLEAALAMLEVDEADRIAAEAVIALINAIPDLADMTAADESKVVQARTALNALTNKQRSLVPSEYVNKLISSEARIQLLKDADVVAQLIAQLPAAADVTIDDEAQIEAARTAYEGLSSQAKALVPAEVIAKLEAAETAIEEIHQADQQAADAVTAQINALKDAAQLTLADEASVNAAADAYDALTQSQKDLVPASALAKLSAAQDRIAILKAADSVSQLINALPASLTLDDAAQVEEARAAYEALSAEGKALVPASELAALEAAEGRIEELRQQAAADETSQVISNLPDPADISVDDAAAIRAARAAYEALTDEEKALVPEETLEKLEAAEAALAEAFSNVDGWLLDEGYWYYYVSGVPQTGWQKINGKWYYMDPETAIMQTGWRKVNGTWYFFKSGGAMVTGWQKINGIWYYFKSGGAMVTGWQKIDGTWYFFKSGGAMVTGWYKDGSSWYFFKSSGAMAANEWCDGYWLNANGTWTYKPRGSWHKDSKGWWFGDTSGWYAKNTTIKIDGKNYSFNASGYMK